MYVHQVQIQMKSTKVKNPQRNKCSAVVEKNCLVAEYRTPYRIRPRIVIGVSLSEPHVVRSTAEISVVCLSVDVCRRKYVRPEKICCFNLHTGFYFAFSRAQFGRFHVKHARGSHYTVKSSRSAIKVVSNLRVTVDNTTNVTHSEARRQEKLRKRRERDRRRRAKETAEKKEERLAIRREKDRASRQLRTIEARHTRLDQDRADHQRRRASETPEARQAGRYR